MKIIKNLMLALTFLTIKCLSGSSEKPDSTSDPKKISILCYFCPEQEIPSVVKVTVQPGLTTYGDVAESICLSEKQMFNFFYFKTEDTTFQIEFIDLRNRHLIGFRFPEFYLNPETTKGIEAFYAEEDNLADESCVDGSYRSEEDYLQSLMSEIRVAWMVATAKAIASRK